MCQSKYEILHFNVVPFSLHKTNYKAREKVIGGMRPNQLIDHVSKMVDRGEEIQWQK